MSNDASKYRDDERTRPCNTCRMPVSILATKCRYCGAELGRPREETRSLTTQDLGGETVKHYAPSSNVMDALESFRTEQAAQKRKTSSDANEPDMPELDARSRALATAIRATPTGRPGAGRRFSWGDYGRYALGGVTAVVLVAVAITVIPRFTTGQAQDDVFINRTPGLIELGAPPLEILDAALEGMRLAPGDESEALYAQARDLVHAEVMGNLTEDDFTRRHLDLASRLASQAADQDPRTEMQALKTLVDNEVVAYNIVLTEVDASAGTVKYRVARANEELEASRDELILDRFQISRFSGNSVRLRDRERGGRELLWSIGGQPTPR